jgi:hypothetical protein
MIIKNVTRVSEIEIVTTVIEMSSYKREGPLYNVDCSINLDGIGALPVTQEFFENLKLGEKIKIFIGKMPKTV